MEVGGSPGLELLMTMIALVTSGVGFGEGRREKARVSEEVRYWG